MKEFEFHSFQEEADSLIKSLYLYWKPTQDYIISIKAKARILMALRLALELNNNTCLNNARKYNISPLLDRIIKSESIPKLINTPPDNTRIDSLTNNVILSLNGEYTLEKITNLIFQEMPNELISKYDKNRNVLRNILHTRIKQILISLTQKGYITWL